MHTAYPSTDPSATRTVTGAPQVAENAGPGELEKNLHNASEPANTPPERSGRLRRELFGLRDAWRPHTHRPRIAKCGWTRAAAAVAVRTVDGSSAYAGLIKCRSKACPVCLAARRSAYASEILRVCEIWQRTQSHHGVYMATFTIRHSNGDALERIGPGVRAAWRRMVSSMAWQNFRGAWGIQYICAEEVTHGDNGWHPHLHVLFLPRRVLGKTEYRDVATSLFVRWQAAVIRELGEEYAPERIGNDFRPARREDYISKAVGLELADPGTKRGKRFSSGRTPVQLLRDFANRESEASRALYLEYESAMSGRRDLTWSRGLRSLREQARAELSAERKALESHIQAVFPAGVWDRVRHVPGARVAILESAQRQDIESIEALLKRHLGQWAVDETRRLGAVATGIEWIPEPLQRAREARGPPQRITWRDSEALTLLANV